MKPPIEYRQPRPASSSGRTPDFGSGKPGSHPGAGTKLQHSSVEERGAHNAQVLGSIPNAATILAHKRALKAASQKRWRAKHKAK